MTEVNHEAREVERRAKEALDQAQVTVRRAIQQQRKLYWEYLAAVEARIDAEHALAEGWNGQ